jgi:hypothetical protein
MEIMKNVLRFVGVLAVLGATSVVGLVPTAAAQDDARVAAVGRIVDLDGNHGYAIVEFPNGRMFVTMDKRDMGKFIVGDELRIDSFGRPLPPQSPPRRAAPPQR